MTKTLIIYHQVKPGVDCADGIAAAWVAAKKYPDSTVIGDCYHSETKPDVSHFERVVIVDFSYPASLLEQWREKASEVIVIDHHKIALEMLKGLSNKVLKHFDMNECGATLAWKTLFPDESMPTFLEYVRDRDLCNFELPASQDVHEAILSMRSGLKKIDKSPRIFRLFDTLSKLDGDDLVTLGYAIGRPRWRL